MARRWQEKTLNPICLLYHYNYYWTGALKNQFKFSTPVYYIFYQYSVYNVLQDLERQVL